jgi:hypothetical protein
MLGSFCSVDSTFIILVHYPPNIEDGSWATQAKEYKMILLRLAFAVTAVMLVFFIIGAVCMQLMDKAAPRIRTRYT